MKSAVLINLDYANTEAGTCRRIWSEIASGMAASGFSLRHRLFLADMDQDTACARANDTLSSVEERLAANGIAIFDAIREFYWFEYLPSSDRLALSNEIPEVSFVNMDDFRRVANADSR